MTGEEKKTITRKKHPGGVAQGHKLVALNKKRKEEILRNKEQPTIQSIVQSTVQSTVQSNGAYVYGVGILAVLAIGVCVFLRSTRRQDGSSMKNPLNQKDVICFRKIYNK